MCITVAHFYETWREKLRMELVTGQDGLHRLIREGSINRPALALTGILQVFRECYPGAGSPAK